MRSVLLWLLLITMPCSVLLSQDQEGLWRGFRPAAAKETEAERRGGRRHALVIGNANYSHIKSLNNPINDARAIAELLEGFGFLVEKIENASKNTMLAMINAFSENLKKEGSVGIFYYAGHSLVDGGEVYLIPVNADSYLGSGGLGGNNQYVSLGDHVFDAVGDNLDQSKIVILDSCLYGSTWPPESPHFVLMKANIPPSTLVAYATYPGQPADDGVWNGVFTKELLKELAVPNVPIESVLTNAREGVIDATTKARFKQLPWVVNSIPREIVVNIQTMTRGEILELVRVAILEAEQREQAGELEEAVRIYREVRRNNIGIERDRIKRRIELLLNEIERRKDRENQVIAEEERLRERELRIEILEKDLIKFPRDVDTMVELGDLLLSQRYEDSLRLYRRALAVRPGYPRAWLSLNRAIRNNTNLRDAISTLRYKRAPVPKPILAPRPSDVPVYNESLDRDRKRAGKDDPVYLFAFGQFLQKEGKLRKAIGKYKKAVELDDKFVSAYEYLCHALYLNIEEGFINESSYKRNRKRTADCYRTLTSLKPDDSTFHYNLGSFLIRDTKSIELTSVDYTHAIASFERAISLRGKYPEALVNRGIALYRMNKLEDALSSYLKSMEDREVDPVTLANIGIVYYEMGRYRNAIDYYQRAVDIDSSLVSALANQGVAYDMIGEINSALEIYRMTESLHNLGLYHHLMGDYSNAIDLYTSVGDHGTSDTYFNMGHALKEVDEKSNVRLAIRNYREAMYRESDREGAIYCNLARLYYVKGDSIETWHRWGLVRSVKRKLRNDAMDMSAHFYEKAITADSSCPSVESEF